MLFFDLFRREPTIVALKPGEILFREGDPSSGLMYVLVSGQAHVVVGGRVVEVLDSGMIVGEMAMVGSEPRSATVPAVTTCQFAEINDKRFEFLVTEMPGFAIEVMRVLAARLRRADRLLRESIERTA